MLITKLRSKNGQKISTQDLINLEHELNYRLKKAGFITCVEIKNSSSIKVGMRMCSFVIDTDKLGHNARVNTYTRDKTKAGYKRTNTPTWTQREEFNHLVNNTIDSFKFKANVRSGDYSIRSYNNGRVNQWDMPEPFSTAYGVNVPSVLEIVPMKYAKDAVEWIGINAPFTAAVPETKPRFSRA